MLSIPVFRLASFSFLVPFLHRSLFLPIVYKSVQISFAQNARAPKRDYHHAVASQKTQNFKRWWCRRWSRTSSISAEDRPSSTASLRSVHPRSESSRERTVTSFGVPIHHRASRNHRRVYHRCDGETVQSRVERWRQLRGNPPSKNVGERFVLVGTVDDVVVSMRCIHKDPCLRQLAVRFATTSGWERRRNDDDDDDDNVPRSAPRGIPWCKRLKGTINRYLPCGYPKIRTRFQRVVRRNGKCGTPVAWRWWRRMHLLCIRCPRAAEKCPSAPANTGREFIAVESLE